jgi:hypothetical protein
VHAWRTLRAGDSTGFARPKGRMLSGIVYSMTSAMSPTKKETAYTHLPTYTAGILYHLGTFLSLALLIFFFFRIPIPRIMGIPVAIFLLITSGAGLVILIKRCVDKKLRSISCPDDYASNIFVTGFQSLTAVSLITVTTHPILFIYSGLLFLYIPLGKLKHLLYFFLARFQLGRFYGRRGIWPGKRRHQW